MSKKKDKPIIETKLVKHEFTSDEVRDMGQELARCFGSKRGIESEFDQIKAGFKARIAEADAKIDAVSTNITNGFELRSERCRVEMNPKKGEKNYYLENGSKNADPVLTEPMREEDYQPKLPLDEKSAPFNPVLSDDKQENDEPGNT